MVGTGGEALAGGLLIDTNIVIAAFKEEASVLEKLREILSEQLFVPAIVLGELHYGARGSARTGENLERLEAFARGSNVLPCDETTARLYGSVRDALRRRGRPIPENDIWIAAVALQHDLVLASRDSHFEHVEGLQLDRW